MKLSGRAIRKRTVEIDMVIRRQYLDQIPDDSKAAISAANLLGDKYINITRGSHPKHVEAGGEIDVAPDAGHSRNYGAEFAACWRSSRPSWAALDGLLAIVESGQGNIGKLIKDDSLYDRLNATAGEVEQLVKDVKNSNGTISHLLYDDDALQRHPQADSAARRHAGRRCSRQRHGGKADLRSAALRRGPRAASPKRNRCWTT